MSDQGCEAEKTEDWRRRNFLEQKDVTGAETAIKKRKERQNQTESRAHKKIKNQENQKDAGKLEQ